jgi:hypothetical protein
MATPPLDQTNKCTGIGAKGKRCRKRAVVGDRCRQHPLPALVPLSVIVPTEAKTPQSLEPFGGLDPSKREDGPGCIAWIARELLEPAPRIDPQTAHVIIGGIKAVMRATDLGGNKKRPGVRFETVRSRADADRIIAASDEAATL